MDKNNGSKPTEKKILDELKRIGGKLEDIEDRLSYIEEQTGIPDYETYTSLPETEKEEEIEQITTGKEIKTVEKPAAEKKIKKEGIMQELYGSENIPGKVEEEEIVEEISVGEYEEKKETKKEPEIKVKEPKEEIPEQRRDIEEDIGRKWLGYIGVISLFLGVAFFVKYSLDQGYFGPMGKITMGILIGLILLVIGEITDKRKYLYFARSVTGLGFAILYITL